MDDHDGRSKLPSHAIGTLPRTFNCFRGRGPRPGADLKVLPVTDISSTLTNPPLDTEVS